MTYWITEVDDNEYANNHASGIIANRMAAESVNEIGFRILHYPRMYAEELRTEGKEARQVRLESLLSAVLPGDIVIVQYPLWTNYTEFEVEFIDYLSTVRKAKIVAMVWDILSWIHDNRERDYTGDASLWMLNRYDLVIAANPKMARRLASEGGVNKPLISMDLTDFVYQGPLKEKRFIKELYYVATGIDPAILAEYASKVPINFIGPHQKEAVPDYIKLLGPMKSIDIPSQLEGGFGLLYYAKGSGYKGMHHYGEYNNPMKLSLYLASGLPVIVMANSAHAEWIAQRGVGIVVNSLAEIDAKIDALTETDYEQMLENIKPWQMAVTQGFFSKQAAIETVRYLELGFTDRLVNVEE
ncbi:beta-1,6-galactofuranosyltransferase [Weissella oryzae SG25]|uniref:Beta-1,6-galactofuranosyltransferase n=1 Tax=Weissella oryzae (strain DSM 25784 / JCM 18191 / LMG 30913 / SG25) TaxID=1329250 RepID=A0A069CUL7_WEIOS|nr:beta-1,6-galactofuranosyltransferase [Weissella oryzae]GAK31174.1 beta-1,6-galactofuranosyltransferase [Weissella oryzae SG25]